MYKKHTTETRPMGQSVSYKNMTILEFIDVFNAAKGEESGELIVNLIKAENKEVVGYIITNKEYSRQLLKLPSKQYYEEVYILLHDNYPNYRDTINHNYAMSKFLFQQLEFADIVERIHRSIDGDYFQEIKKMFYLASDDNNLEVMNHIFGFWRFQIWILDEPQSKKTIFQIIILLTVHPEYRSLRIRAKCIDSLKFDFYPDEFAHLPESFKEMYTTIKNKMDDLKAEDAPDYQLYETLIFCAFKFSNDPEIMKNIISKYPSLVEFANCFPKEQEEYKKNKYSNATRAG